MDSEIVHDTIRSTVQACLPGSRILLFGSHARGYNNRDSDYDLLIITANILTRAEKLNYSSQLHKAIVRAIHAPADLLLYSEDEIAEKKKLPGHIVRSALREGVAL